jgi:hypothetical protein
LSKRCRVDTAPDDRDHAICFASFVTAGTVNRWMGNRESVIAEVCHDQTCSPAATRGLAPIHLRAY